MTYVSGGDRNQVRLLIYDVIGSIPVAGIAGRMFWSTDEERLYRDTGAAWVQLTPGSLELNPGLADETADGVTAPVTVGENVVTGDTLFLQNDGKYWKSDADGAATMPIKVLVVDATIAADATGIVLHAGYYRNDGRYNWTPGAGVANLLYAHTTFGEIVQFANKPVGAGDQLQVVGYIVNADVIYFDPSLVLAEFVP